MVRNYSSGHQMHNTPAEMKVQADGISAWAGEYMTLPASQYSVLDAKKIERIDENTFRCHVGGLHFFSFVVEPVLTVSVMVGDRGPTVKLLETKVRKFTLNGHDWKAWCIYAHARALRNLLNCGGAVGRLSICCGCK